MPTPAEALELGVDQTTPVAEIRFGGNEPRVVDATSVELSTS